MKREVNSSSGRGGTFCRFAVGSHERGASARHLRYIARSEAVLEQGAGTLLWNLDGLEASNHANAVAQLMEFARTEEAREIGRHHSRGHARTHYRVLLSFETHPDVSSAGAMAQEWLAATFPAARAAVFFHGNTAHLHAHVWMSARQIDGRKINLSARAFRQIDEAWNHAYARGMGLPEHEHLHKKWQTEAYKMKRRAGEEAERPSRVADSWNPTLFNEQEREQLGVREKDDERDEGGTGANQRATSERIDRLPEPTAALRDALAAADKGLQNAERGLQNAERAVLQAREVHAASASLAERSAKRAHAVERQHRGAPDIQTPTISHDEDVSRDEDVDRDKERGR